MLFLCCYFESPFPRIFYWISKKKHRFSLLFPAVSPLLSAAGRNSPRTRLQQWPKYRHNCETQAREIQAASKSAQTPARHCYHRAACPPAGCKRAHALAIPSRLCSERSTMAATPPPRSSIWNCCSSALYVFVAMVLAPAFVVFLMAQKDFIRDLAFGAAKGCGGPYAFSRTPSSRCRWHPPRSCSAGTAM